MIPISDTDIKIRVSRDNPWWANPSVQIPESQLPRRAYFDSLKSLALDFTVRRATVMLGPRRVGKTVMIKQLVSEALISGIKSNDILYISIDTPLYSGKPLEYFLSIMDKNIDSRRLVIFDEIQYLPNWEQHLKDLVDNHPQIKFVATGSAAAALKLKSQESGAGRFSDFMLPPLTFYEFLKFIDEDEILINTEYNNNDNAAAYSYVAKDIEALNRRFIDYLNYGGYPEAVFNEKIRLNPEQFIKNDIIDKVLLKDLPSLYGIHEIQELNRLFAVLAYNAGNEASFENISRESGISKPTIKRYIEYLESAFLIIKVNTVDDNCRSMKRERNFKIYLNNPSMRAALFTPVGLDDSERVGHLTESAIFSQWQHSPSFRNIRYARWRNDGEVDIVYLHDATQVPHWIGEIKWSDRIEKHYGDETKSIQTLLRKHKSILSCFITTKTIHSSGTLEGRDFMIWPSSLYCYTVGRNITTRISAGTKSTITPPIVTLDK